MLSNKTNRSFPGRLLVGGLALFAMGALFGWLTGLDVNHEQAPDITAIEETPQAEEPAAQVETQREIMATKDTHAEWIARFTQCGHEIRLESQGDVTGLDREETAARFPDFEIELFTTARVRMVKKLDSLCPAHYQLRLVEQGVGVFRTNPETFEPEQLMVLAVDQNVMSVETAEALRQGLVFDSLAGINEYLEGTEDYAG